MCNIKATKYLLYLPLLAFLCFLVPFLPNILLVFVQIYSNEMYHNPHLYPCLHCHPHSYIRMVQHLIERCLLLHMSRDQCVKALAEHASIRPVVTLTVWRELQRENKDFFQAYFHAIPPRPLMRRYIQRAPRLSGKEWKLC